MKKDYNSLRFDLDNIIKSNTYDQFELDESLKDANVLKRAEEIIALSKKNYKFSDFQNTIMNLFKYKYKLN